MSLKKRRPKLIGSFSGRRGRIKPDKRVRKLNGVKGLQIVDGLANADEVNWKGFFGTHLRYGDKNAAFGSAVEFGDDESG